ncbi:efflux transporter outer membrane subunit [Desulforhopalus sp. IMCC35007]|uniref:efflux transporter outer membrane subunit n=1 Tax=Desulforhopalus sp. IMCC35007 TaxID=2569543 RepID=UPI0010AE1230|nr:efflux transporter outer membrane subunit [Desulforhopalus sp. IMCC35007]TKB09258.1 efflux transporter outer membrane subunit [Desulforhopalus sp. IMCC35007]
MKGIMQRIGQKNSRIVKVAVTGIFGLLLSGCTVVGPDYVQPETRAPEKWSTSLAGGLSPEAMDPQKMASWWTTLHDPRLTSLIQRAVAGNLDLRKARARVREARARRGIAAADRFPTINTEGTVSKIGTSQELGGGADIELYGAGFDANWELDLFGGVQRAVEAADAELAASHEELRDVMVSLLAEVGLNYVELRSFQTRLSIAKANQKAQEETCNITRARAASGVTSELDVEQARYNLEQTRSQIPPLQRGVEQAGNRLAVLLGKNPGSLKDELIEMQPIPVTPLEVAVGLPADALRRRPDVRRAEQQLVAQTARIGVATAYLYPKFKLAGSIGLISLSSGNFFSDASRSYSVGPQFYWNVFDSGRIRQNIEVQNALQEQALISYEASVLLALEEVENALIAYADEQVRRRSLVEAAGAAGRAVQLAEDQYSSGLIDFQNVLNAQRALLSLQDQLATSDGAVTSNLIRLYKALGGGWTPAEAAAPSAQK